MDTEVTSLQRHMTAVHVMGLIKGKHYVMKACVRAMYRSTYSWPDTSWWVVSFTPRPLYPQGKSPWYPLDTRLGVHQTSLDHVENRKISALLGPELRTHDRPARSQLLYRLRCPGFWWDWVNSWNTAQEGESENLYEEQVVTSTQLYEWTVVKTRHLFECCAAEDPSKETTSLEESFRFLRKQIGWFLPYGTGFRQRCFEKEMCSSWDIQHTYLQDEGCQMEDFRGIVTCEHDKVMVCMYVTSERQWKSINCFAALGHM
jgi:hypothetical protein